MTISKFTKALLLLLMLMGFIHNSYATNTNNYSSYDPATKTLEIPEIYISEKRYTNINLDLCSFAKNHGLCFSPKPKPMGVIIDEIELKVISAKKIADGKLDIEFTLTNKVKDQDQILYIGDPSLAGGFSEKKFRLVDNNGFIYSPETITSKLPDGTWLERYLTYIPFAALKDEPKHYILTYPNFDPQATSISLLRIYLELEGGRFYQLTDIPIN